MRINYHIISLAVLCLGLNGFNEAQAVTPANSSETCPVPTDVFSQKLDLKSAKLSPEVALKSGKQLVWSRNGSATWNVSFDSAVKDAFLVLDFSTANRTLNSKIKVNGKEYVFKLPSTTGKKNGVVYGIGKVNLPAGKCEISIWAEKGSRLNLRDVTLTTKEPRDPFAPVPSFFVQEKSWAESMVASREKFNSPEIKDEFAAFGKDLDELMNLDDGEKMWEAFPKESDWFLQDQTVIL